MCLYIRLAKVSNDQNSEEMDITNLGATAEKGGIGASQGKAHVTMF